MTAWTGSSGSPVRTSRSASASSPRGTRRAGAILLAALFACAAPLPPSPNDPYLVVLGSAQDGGFPHASCHCAHCASARSEPSLARAVASLALVVPASGRRYLIDATPDLRSQLDRLPRDGRHARPGIDRAPVDGVLLTHAHAGHYLGLAFFGFEAVHTRGLPVHATPRMARFLRENVPWSRLVSREEIAIVETPPGVPYELEPGLSITPFAVPHRDEDSDTVGYRITGPRRTVLYVPDTDGWSRWDPGLLEILAGVDIALLDGTFHSASELPGRDVRSIGHPLVTETMDLLDDAVRANGIAVFFTHFNHSNPLVDPRSKERAAVDRRGFGVLADGQILPL